MKKLVFAICIALIGMIIFSCNHTGSGSADQSTKDSQAKALTSSDTVTLNGIPLDKASAMIKSFLANRGSYDKTTRTSIWFSKANLHSMDSIMISKSADGLRIYFAKNPDGRNSIVLTSTTYGGVSAQNGYAIHNDIFQSKADEPYANDAAAAGVPGYDELGGDALLYTNDPKCPPVGKDGCDATKPHYITCQRADSMVNYFGKDKINATSEWFDAQIIKDLDSAINVQGGDGLRMYFGRDLKPKTTAATDTVHMHGIVLITTKPNGNTHKDYFDCIVTNPSPNKAMHMNLIKKDKTKGVEAIIDGGTNNGEQCPNNCNGTKLPTP